MRKGILRTAMALLFIWMLPQNAQAAQMLIPVGQVIGLELGNDTVTVAAFEESEESAAKAAGIQIGDEILSIDDHPIRKASDIRNALNLSDGSVELQILRDQQTHTLQVHPRITESGPRLGIFLKQGITGIGTVTFYDPQTHLFGTLGHGVNDKSGKLLKMANGNAYPALILSVKKGISGEPGQLLGSLSQNEPSGLLIKNTPQGVFGKSDQGWEGTALPTGEAHTGSAAIRSTIQGTAVQEYSVEILKIYSSDRQSGRNMLLRITDPALLETTGGIVQGMSGSPIIQDGKLVGAVTHVLVNDPTTGYGIFIENMLEAAS